jgi:3'-phosphoadenosine 5'-phosphosulfate (PAPS) 3'-phosphatase
MKALMSPKQRDKFRESMIKFFSDEDRDMSALMDTAKKMERIAKDNKGKKKSVNLEVYGINPQHEDYEDWITYSKAISYSQSNIMSSGIKSFSVASQEPAHNNHENYRTVHN